MAPAEGIVKSVYLLKEKGFVVEVVPPPTFIAVGVVNLKFARASAMADAENIEPGVPPFIQTSKATIHETAQHTKITSTTVPESSLLIY